MDEVAPIGRSWELHLQRLVGDAQKSLLISSPYITSVGCSLLRESSSNAFKSGGEITVLTDLSPLCICQGATDPAALRTLFNNGYSVTVQHLPKLHAKVYIADEEVAIVTSGNLTAGGVFQNYEYGIRLSEPSIVRKIRADVSSYASLGATVTDKQLALYTSIADEVRDAFKTTQASIARGVRRRFEAVVRHAEDELVRFRLAGGAMHTVFARTILYLLETYGPLTTIEIHSRVETIHPDLCDNTVDRVIDGKRFGKKWKHAVRTAQQQLKKRGLIELRGEAWHTTGKPPAGDR